MFRPLTLALMLSTLAVTGCAHSPPAGPTSADGLLAVGTAVPDLQAVDQDGKSHHLAETRGHYTVVYFYPKDATPGCTKEACAFRDVWQKYQEAGVLILGVSSQDQASKAAFAQEHHLTFPLLADTEHKWIDAFGVPSTLGMARRVTFLVDPDGKVAKVYRDVDPGVHALQVLEDVTAARK
jgi:peroxiredoxin Q/BCP